MVFDRAVYFSVVALGTIGFGEVLPCNGGQADFVLCRLDKLMCLDLCQVLLIHLSSLYRY